jgi:hypothetical protein
MPISKGHIDFSKMKYRSLCFQFFMTATSLKYKVNHWSISKLFIRTSQSDASFQDWFQCYFIKHLLNKRYLHNESYSQKFDISVKTF